MPDLAGSGVGGGLLIVLDAIAVFVGWILTLPDLAIFNDSQFALRHKPILAHA